MSSNESSSEAVFAIIVSSVAG